MAKIGLYYPYIQFKDEAWLKMTALYWDQMARIVPRGFTLEDSDSVRMLVDEAGYVFQRHPSTEELKVVGEHFEKLVQHYGDQLAKRYSLEKRDAWPKDPVTAATEPNGDPRLAYIYPTKMKDSLAATLMQSGLAEYGPSRPDIGIGMHPRLADTYMIALAEVASANSGYEPVTDETRNHIAIAACSLDELVQALLAPVEVARPISGELHAEAALLCLAFRSVVPTKLEDVPMRVIVDVRQSWQAERGRFQEGIESIIKELGEVVDVQDAEGLERHLAVEYERKIAQPLEELRTQLRRAKVDSVLGAFSIATALPAGTVGAILLSGLAPWLAASVAIGYSAYKFISAHRDKTKKLLKSKLAYLLRLEQELAPSRLTEWVDSDIKSYQLG